MAQGLTSTLQKREKGNDMGGAVSSIGNAVNNIGDSFSDAVIDPIKDNWVDLRDTAEAAAVVAGNYYLPGSSMLTSNLVTKGAQEQLNTDLGQVANLAAGATGGYQGNLSNYGEIGNAISGGGSAAGPELLGDAGMAAGSGGGSAASSGSSGGGLGNFGNIFGSGAPEALGEASGAWATTPAAASGTGLLGSAINWATASPQNALTAAGLGLTAAKALGGSSTPDSSTASTSIDPQMKEAYLRNLEEARGVAANLGAKQFAAFPEYSTNMVQQYMNPYQEGVINTTMAGLERQRQMQQINDLNAATRAKAFGGSRQGVAEALTNEAAQRTAASTLANLQSQGFSQAQTIALQQEEAKRAYEQQKLDAVRNLGLERLNVSSSALGIPLSNLGGTTTTPIYKNQTASALGGALSGGMLGNMIGGSSGAGYGALAGGLLGFL
jgi:hypothetical protein